MDNCIIIGGEDLEIKNEKDEIATMWDREPEA